MDYYIHDNGGRPFKVTVTDSHADVYKHIDWDFENESIEWESNAIQSFDYQRIFIGKSPLNSMTEFSGGHGSKFDGNTMLLDLGGGGYVYIGGWIKKFTTDKKIVEYVSHVGNNDVPYPYAIDSDGDYYFIIEDVIVSNVPKEFQDNPYTYYYEKNHITARLYNPPKPPLVKDFQGIREFYIGDDPYMMVYRPNGAEDYDRLIEDIGSPISVVKTDGKKYELTRDEYALILDDFGKMCGFRPLEAEILVRRAGW